MQYAEYVRQRFYIRYGFTDLLPFFPVATIGKGSMATMLDTLNEVVPEEVIRKRFLFQALPNFLAYEPLPPPTAWAVTEPWTRVDGQFSIIETLKSVATRKQKGA